MPMNREELQDRIAKIDTKIEKINKRITKWSVGMSEEAKELCKAVLDTKEGSQQQSAAYHAYRDFYNLHKDDPAVENPNDYNKGPSMYELWSAYVDLRTALATKEKYQTKINEINNFENEEKIPVLVEFLNNWEAQAREYYLENAAHYFDLEVRYKEELDKYLASLDPEYYVPSRKYRYEQDFKSRFMSSVDMLTKDITHIKKKVVYKDEKHWDYDYVPDSYEVDEQLLDRRLKEEKEKKYKDLVNRVTAVVGNIQDVSNLHIAATGQLNGIIIGDAASAKVETIGAGGWNVQVFHYRLLIHKIK